MRADIRDKVIVITWAGRGRATGPAHCCLSVPLPADVPPGVHPDLPGAVIPKISVRLSCGHEHVLGPRNPRSPEAAVRKARARPRTQALTAGRPEPEPPLGRGPARPATARRPVGVAGSAVAGLRPARGSRRDD